MVVALKARLLPQSMPEAAASRNNNDNNNPGPHKTVRLLVENLTAAPINLEGWIKDDHAHGDCKKKLLETITPPNTATFAPHDNGALGFINQTYIIAAVAPLTEELPHVQ